MPLRRPKAKKLKPSEAVVRIGASRIARELIRAYESEDWEAVLDVAYEFDPSQFEED